MRIALNGQLFKHANKTGIAWSAHNLILELSKYPENECIIQVFSGFHKKTMMRQLKVYEEAGCEIENCAWFSYALYKVLWLFFPIPYRLFFHSKPDITQFFDFTAAPGVSGKSIAVIHDMAYRSCPQTVRFKTRNWLRAGLKRSCRYTDHIFTVSEFSKKEIMKYLHISPQQITVVPNAVDHTRYHTHYTKQQIQKVLDKYHIESEYFLYLGTIEPRKNLGKLICAYAALVKKKEKVPLLVLAGTRGWKCRNIYQKVKELHLEKQVRFPGYIDQEDSPALMAGAAAFVFPSLYEGFGMPPLEAMACGTPVIVSNTASLPEVAGNAGILVNPGSEKELYQAMKKLLEDDGYRKKLGMLGVQRAQEFTWEKSAHKMMEVYEKLWNIEQIVDGTETE